MAQLNIVIMAAGKGTRMKSTLPKVLQPLAGKPLLAHVLSTAMALQPDRIVLVCGHAAEAVQTYAEQWATPEGMHQLVCVQQNPQLGTGHCLQQAVPYLLDGPGSITLVLSGDVPLIQADSLRSLLARCHSHAANQTLLSSTEAPHLSLLAIDLPQPLGYGRIVLKNIDSHSHSTPSVLANAESIDRPVEKIVEEKDASPAERSITLCYSGMLAAPTEKLCSWLARLDDRNAAREFYLTDIVRHAVADNHTVRWQLLKDSAEASGINTFAQLAELERYFQERQALALMTSGVRIADPKRLDIRGNLDCQSDVFIDVGCIFSGRVTLGKGVEIGPYCSLTNVQIESGTKVAAFCHIEGAADQPIQIGRNAQIGPYARLRPGTVLAADVHIGNFVEVKNSRVRVGAKANHLAYLGDADIGERVNFGAGAITANYDGANKHQTLIGADVHVGSNSVLVAPVQLGAGGTIAAGSVISKDTPEGNLSITRAPQKSIPWARPKKRARQQSLNPESSLNSVSILPDQKVAQSPSKKCL